VKIFKDISVEQAKKHGVVSILCHIVPGFKKKDNTLENYLAFNIFKINNDFNRCKVISNILNKNGINHYFAKSFFSSFIVYQNIYVRSYKDIDIFIDKKHYKKFFKLIKKLKFNTLVNEYYIKKLYIPLKIEYQAVYKDFTLDIHPFETIEYNQHDFINMKIKNTEFSILNTQKYLKFLYWHAKKHRYMYLKDLIDIYFLEKKINKKNLFYIKNKIIKAISNNPEEGKISDYAQAFIRLDFKQKLNFIIRHVLLPQPADFDIVTESIFFVLIKKIFKNILNFCKRVLK